MAFALSGFLAAVAGCLLVHINQAYTENRSPPTESIGIFTAAVVGGLGSLTGAVLGALYLNGGTWFLTDKWRLLPSAIGVLVVLMVFPGGLGNLLYRGARRRSSVAGPSARDRRPELVADELDVGTERRSDPDDGSAPSTSIRSVAERRSAAGTNARRSPVTALDTDAADATGGGPRAC